ncbi:radical SAM protein [Bacteroides cellulosilyticus]|uniref:radical SAM protein n=1 Tax=Bacteroides cellulosilyticus TaxID=246787 RepID=UPI0018994372|nr:radical SAM protein [Bacteroides cellulosilyticus]
MDKTITIPTTTEASIDMSTICQLRCVECSTSKGITHTGIIGKGQLSFDDFVKFVDDNRQITRIEMSNWGEIFLNRDILRIMEYAFQHGVTLYCGNGTNFNYVPEKVLEGLVKYQVEYLNLSIDGATQETYEQYRRGGNFHQVLKNIERLNYYKAKYNSPYPKLSWQFVIFGHNEHEIPHIKQLCSTYNMVFNPKLNYSNFSPVKDKEFVRRESGLGVADRAEHKKKYGAEYKSPCYHCFSSPQINWNGDILGCSVNKWRILGNVRETNLSDWEASMTFGALVNLLFLGVTDETDLPCYHCPNLQKVLSKPLTLEGLKAYNAYIAPALRK